LESYFYEILQLIYIVPNASFSVQSFFLIIKYAKSAQPPYFMVQWK